MYLKKKIRTLYECKAYEKIEELHLYIFDLEERLRKVEGRK